MLHAVAAICRGRCEEWPVDEQTDRSGCAVWLALALATFLAIDDRLAARHRQEHPPAHRYRSTVGLCDGECFERARALAPDGSVARFSYGA